METPPVLIKMGVLMDQVVLEDVRRVRAALK